MKIINNKNRIKLISNKKQRGKKMAYLRECGCGLADLSNRKSRTNNSKSAKEARSQRAAERSTSKNYGLLPSSTISKSEYLTLKANAKEINIALKRYRESNPSQFPKATPPITSGVKIITCRDARFTGGCTSQAFSYPKSGNERIVVSNKVKKVPKPKKAKSKKVK